MTVTAVPDPAPATAGEPDFAKAEADFLDRDFSEEGAPAEEPPKPAVAATAQPGVQSPAQPSPQDEAATAELEALLDRPVPADDRFPKKFHGRPMRELANSIIEADKLITTMGADRATLRDQVVAAQATARVLAQQLKERGGAPATETPAVPAADDPMSFFTRHGFKDPMREFTADPNAFFAKLVRGAVVDAQAAIEAKWAPRFEPIEESVGRGEDDRNIGNLRKASDAAFDLIAEKDKITDPAIRKAARARFDGVFAANEAALARHVGMLHKAGQADMYDPNTWVKFYRGYEEAMGGFSPLVQPAAPAVLPTGVRQNPPHSARSTTSSSASGGKRVTARQSKAVRDMLRESGLPADQLDEMAGRVEANLEEAHATGMIRE
jgi:hypothetical protein